MKIKTVKGRLTIYGFACGYIEQFDFKDLRVTLWLDSCWNIRAHEFNGRGRLFWDTFDNEPGSIIRCRKLYDATKKKIMKGAM